MLKRPLLIMTAFFAVGIYAGLQYENRLTIILISVMAVFIAFFLLPKRRAMCIGAALCLLLGLGRIELAQQRRESIAARYGGKTSVREMVVTDFSDSGKVIVSFEDKGKDYKAYLWTSPEPQLYPGDIISGDFSLTEPYSSKTSVTDFSAYLCSMDVYLYARADNIEVIGRHTDGIDGIIYSARTYMDKVGKKHFDKTARAFFNAMVFGDKRLISTELSEALQASGLNHIAVVSGMHISIIIMVQAVLLRKFFGKRRYISILAVLGAILITALTGAGASILRALVMSIIFQFATFIYRENDTVTTLGSSALIMLIANPYFLFNAGFVLSVLSVLGLILYSGKFTRAMKRILPGAVGESLAVSSAAQLAVTPALVIYFRIVTPYALVANLLIFSTATIFAVAGMVFFFLSEVPLISDLMRWAMQFMSDITEAVCYGVASVPGARLETGNATAFFLLGWVLVMVLVYMYPVKTRTVKVLLCMFAAMGIICNSLSDNYKMELSFADYGGRSMSAVRLSGGESILIDCPDFNDALIYEETSGENFDCAVLTTARTGEVYSFLKHSNVRMLVVPQALVAGEKKEELLFRTKEENVRVIFLEDGQCFGIGGAWIEYFPVRGAEGKALRIIYKDEVFVTLQGLSGIDIGKLCREEVKINCDYLKIPYTVFHEGTTAEALTDGKVIGTNKSVIVR